jgi:hypothetical protein
VAAVLVLVVRLADFFVVVFLALIVPSLLDLVSDRNDTEVFPQVIGLLERTTGSDLRDQRKPPEDARSDADSFCAGLARPRPGGVALSPQSF